MRRCGVLEWAVGGGEDGGAHLIFSLGGYGETVNK